MLKVDYGFL
jgi:hypothetical protein